MNKLVTLKSCLYGHVDRIVSKAVLLLLMAAVVGGVALFQLHVYELSTTGIYSHTYSTLPLPYVLGFAAGAAVQIVTFVLFCVNICRIVEYFYSAKKSMTLTVSDEIKQVECTVYLFPLTIARSSSIFDRITDVEVRQSLYGRLTDTGDILISAITYTNADVIETDFQISGIEAPYAKKSEIEQFVTPHDGVRVKLGE